MNGDKMNTDKPGYCLANKEVIEDHEQRIKDLESGGGVSSIQGVDPINIATVEGTTNISLKTGQGLTVDNNGFVGVDINTNKGLVLENGKLKVNLETENSTVNYDQVSGKIYANINGMLKDGADITFDSYGPSLPRAIKPTVSKIETGSDILNATGQNLCGATAIKEALTTKQNKLTAPVTGGLVITGSSENMIGINFKNNGGITYDENGAVMIDDTVVQKKLTAGAGLKIENNVVQTKYSGGVPRIGSLSFGTTTFTAGQTKVLTQDLNLPDSNMDVPANAPWWVIAFEGQTQGLIARACRFVPNGNVITARIEVHNAGGADKQATLTIGYMGWIA